MKKKRHEAEESFYSTCAMILGVEHHYKPWEGRGPNRWNNRHSGNGKYDSIGIIRMFSPTLIHMAILQPSVSKTFKCAEDAFDYLRALPK